MHQLTLYSKPGCCLCDKAKVLIDRLRPDYSFELTEVDITADPALFEQYRFTIPVVVVDDQPAITTKVSEYRMRQALESSSRS